jgi:hypothetical protein
MRWDAVTPDRARAVADGLRGLDRVEVLNIYGWSPTQAVMNSIQNSTVQRCICADDGKPLAVCGVTNQGVVWLLATDELLCTERRRRQFLRDGTKWVDGLASSQLWPVLENWVMASNTRTLRWLRWMGFAVGRASADFDASVPLCHVRRGGRW